MLKELEMIFVDKITPQSRELSRSRSMHSQRNVGPHSTEKVFWRPVAFRVSARYFAAGAAAR